MCNNGYTDQAVRDMQQIALECGVHKLFASPAWATVRNANPHGTDIEVLQRLVQTEALRLAQQPIVFFDYEFRRR